MTVTMEIELEENIGPTSALDPSKATSDDENKKEDEIDKPPKSSRITNWDIIFLVWSILMHCSDVCVDISLVVRYLIENKLKMFLWTKALIIVPSFINTLVSMQMYHQDELKSEEESKPKSIWRKFGRFIGFIFIVAFQGTMAQRCYYSLKYSIQTRICEKKNDTVGQRKYFIKMLKEEQDIALLRVLECFIEAAPQQILQLSIFVQDYNGEFGMMITHQLVSIFSSFVSLAWAMVSYHRSIRLAQEDKKNISCVGSVIQFLWHLFITTSRIACVSALAIFSSICVILACFVHWVGMTMWIIMESRGVITFCQNPRRPPHLPLTVGERIKSTLFSCVLGFVYIFIYLNPEDNSTYSRHLFYYTICLLENISAAILILLSLSSDVTIVWYHYFISASCIIPFLTGVITMITYYLKFHPSMKHHTLSLPRILRVK